MAWAAPAKPLLLHFDVNKTIILTDSMDAKTQDVCIRESIADMFWGQTSDPGSGLQWQWCGPGTVGSDLPRQHDSKTMSYHEFCKDVIPDKNDRKNIVRTFVKADEHTQRSMEKMVHQAMSMLELPDEMKNHPGLEAAGLSPDRYLMLPAIFKLVATLVRRKVRFALVFRSFGQDHEKIRNEWNAFCERRHPVFDDLLDGVGPLDGTMPGVPDKRLDRIHTMYRDAEGCILALDTFTNGPKDMSWDAWVKQKPGPKEDTRKGREFLNASGATCVDGVPAVKDWFEQQVVAQCTTAIKDDWAWWTFHKEADNAGKILVALDTADYLFFDDNIKLRNAHIVDCRASNGQSCSEEVVKKVLVRVNPVEALLDEDIFIHEVQTRLEWKDLELSEFDAPLTRSISRDMPPDGSGGKAGGGADGEAASPFSVFNFLACCNGSASHKFFGSASPVKGA